MGLTVKEGGNQSFPPIPPDVYQAVCYGLYDLGSHHDKKFDKVVHQVLLIWELPDLRIAITKDGTTIDKPRGISKTYTLSLGEKANLRKDLQSWRGRPFTAQELEGFDLKSILGVNCMLQIIQIDKDGKKYSQISAILPLFKGMPSKQPENPLQYFSLEDSESIPQGTQQWIWDKIKACDEMQRANPVAETSTQDPSDDVPF
jgi:hypothetical protein